ncbi:MAG: Mov34/MPN/PAD-1 family protein [Lachnospiraceae bacterium]|nr:Mov34/MPN/PAD-1 family protein [Lachnospiraceae bacterium]
MFKQGSLFDDMFGLDDYQSPEEKKEEKKEASTKKEPTKEKRKQSSKKTKEKEISVSLPVTVVAGTWKEEIADINGKTEKIALKDIADYLYQLGYKCMAHKDVVFLTEHLEEHILYVAEKENHSANMDVQLFSASDTVTIAIDGLINAEYSLEHQFSEKRREEVSVTDLLLVFIANYPEYTGCTLNYDIESGILLPEFTKKPVEKISFPCEVKGADGILTIEESDITGKDIARSIFKKATGTVLPDADLFIYENTYGMLVLKFIAKVNKFSSFDKTGIQCANGAKEKKAVEYFYLPLTINLVIYGMTHPLSPEDFNGKEKVTWEEIVTYLQPSYPIFSDPSRKPVHHYLKSHQILGIGFESGKKGYQAESLYEAAHTGPCKLIRSLQDFLAAKAAEFYYGTFYADEKENETGNDITVFSSRLACITARSLGMAKYDNLEFDLRVPKIPKSVMDEVITYFRKDLTREAIVRIYYNAKEDRFQIVKPLSEERNKVNTIYSFINSVRIATETDSVLVCEIHSHNTMPAKFSATDDADEAYGIGFYGVIGEINKEIPHMALRLAFNGSYKLIAWSEIADI